MCCRCVIICNIKVNSKERKKRAIFSCSLNCTYFQAVPAITIVMNLSQPVIQLLQDVSVAWIYHARFRENTVIDIVGDVLTKV